MRDHKTDKEVATNGYVQDGVLLPLPPSCSLEKEDMEIYVRFMRFFRNAPQRRIDLKILSAIQFTADILDLNDALVAKTLVDLGLRAPESAFPQSFIDYIYRAVQRSPFEFGSLNIQMRALEKGWRKHEREQNTAKRVCTKNLKSFHRFDTKSAIRETIS